MMKYTTTLSLILLISISISISISICGASATDEEEDSPVLDTDGNEVEAGPEYTLVASMFEAGHGKPGGLTLDNNCPPNVIQDTLNEVGLPVVFVTLNGPDDEVVRNSSELIIKFVAPTTCDDVSSTAWTLEYNGSLERPEVKLGKVKSGSYFKLEEDLPSEYKLVYCGTHDDCQDIVLLDDDLFSSTRRLVASSPSKPNTPFLFTITRVAEEEEDSPVLDTDGNEVEDGLEYTLVATLLTSGYDNVGGLSLDSNCPPNVVQNISDKVGLPVIFTTLNGPDAVVRVSISELIIEFVGAPTPCDDGSPTAWNLQYNGSLDRSEVKLGKVKEGSYFQLEEDLPSQYRLVYCGTDDDCQEIVLLDDDLLLSSTKRLVALSPHKDDAPFLFTITRATTPEDNLKIRKLPPTLSNPTT